MINTKTLKFQQPRHQSNPRDAVHPLELKDNSNTEMRTTHMFQPPASHRRNSTNSTVIEIHNHNHNFHQGSKVTINYKKPGDSPPSHLVNSPRQALGPQVF